MKTLITACFLATVLIGSDVALSKTPVQNASAKKYPNLAAAQKLVAEAYEKLAAAQKANEWDMHGQAQKAKELLDQVNTELKLAAQAANAAK